MAFAQESTEIGAASSDRIKPLGGELGPNFRREQRRREPTGKSGDRFSRCLSRRDDPEPNIAYVIDGRNLW